MGKSAEQKMAEYLNSQYPGMGTAFQRAAEGSFPTAAPDPINTQYPWLNADGSYNVTMPAPNIYALAGSPATTRSGGWAVGPGNEWAQGQVDPAAAPVAPAGDLRGWWESFIQGKTPDPNFLINNRAAIEGAGWQLENPNAAGIVSKIINPQTGEIIRVLNNADNPSAGVGFNWVPQPTGPGSGAGGGGGYGDYTAPFTEAFSYGEFTPPGDFQAPTWQAPTGVDDTNDPGYSVRLKAGQQALERAASAKGTLLTGGTKKDLTDYAQNYASAEYDKIYGRQYGEYQSDYAKKWGEYLNTYQQQASEWERGYGKALGEYQQRHGIFQSNQGNAFNRLMGVAQLGLQGTNAQAQLGQGYAQNYGNIVGNYGNQATNLTTGAGNATAAGQAASGGAWGNAFGNIGNQLAQSLYAQQMLKQYGGGAAQPKPWTYNP